MGYNIRDPTNFDLDKGGEWEQLAKQLGLMSDYRGGTPRSGYKVRYLTICFGDFWAGFTLILRERLVRF